MHEIPFLSYQMRRTQNHPRASANIRCSQALRITLVNTPNDPRPVMRNAASLEAHFPALVVEWMIALLLILPFSFLLDSHYLVTSSVHLNDNADIPPLIISPSTDSAGPKSFVAHSLDKFFNWLHNTILSTHTTHNVK